MSKGTQIINKRTNTTHFIDEIEVINNETLIFTQDMKCFPISEIIVAKIEDYPLSYSESKTIINFTNSFIQVLRYDLPLAEKNPSYIDKLKNMFEIIWSKLTRSFTSSND
jgi:hypothetical protein